ncbi:MAG: MerR family transcriptional regulator [Gammaproteobacteria bacterium]|nr:MerR family transcriptional regulator [Gammaproteobacteria bacterium]
MKNMDPKPDRIYSADELADVSGTPRRTIRYYIQLGLVDRPVGETRAAHYTWKHLGQLYRIRELAEQGYSLEHIARLPQHGDVRESRPAPSQGTLAVRTHLQLAPGLELVIDPDTARLSPETLRAFARGCLAALARAQQGTHEP